MANKAEPKKRSSSNKSEKKVVSSKDQLTQTESNLANQNEHLLEEIRRLRNEAQEKKDITETLFAITQILGKTLNLQEIFDVILGELQKVVPYDSSSVQVIQDNRLVIVGGRGFDDLQSLLGLGFDLDDETNPSVQVLRTKRQQVFGDVSHHPLFMSQIHGGGKIRGWIGAPLIFGERVIGVITLDKYEPDFYNEELAELAMAFAAQAAVSIENARLFETERIAREQAETLRAATLALGSTLSLRQVFELILSELRKVVPYDSCSVQQLDENEMVIVGGHGFPNLDELLGKRFDWRGPDDPAGEVVHRREPVIIADVSARFEHFKEETHGEGRVHGWMGVPLLFGEHLIGMITLDKLEYDFYKPAHAHLAQAFAIQAAMAFENARLYAETQQRFKETEILRAANVALTQSLDLDTILATLLDYLQQIVPYDTGSVFLLEEDENHLTALAARGYEKWVENADQAVGVSFEFKNIPHIRSVIVDQKIVVIPDVTKHPSWVVAETAKHVRNWLAVPLVAGGKTIGMYSLDKVEPGYFTVEHQRLAENLASQAAIAFQNATLFRNQQVAREQAETLYSAASALGSTLSLRDVFELLLTELRKVVPYDSCSVQQLDGDEMVIVGGHGFPNLDELLGNRFDWRGPDDPAGDVVRRRDPVIIADVSARFEHFQDETHGQGRVHGWMGVPLLFGERMIGMITLDKLEKNYYTPEHAHLAEAFAAQAATAIENARLFETERVAREQAETLRAAALALASTLSLQQVFELLLTELRKVVPYDSCSVQQMDGDEMVIVGGHGFPNLDELLGNRFNWSGPDDPAGDVVRRREPVIIADVSARFEHFNDETHGEGRVHGWMGVPLLFGERMIGMITLDKLEKNFYTAEHAHMAQAFATQAATAIENARLFDETQRLLKISEDRTAELEAISKVSQALIAEAALDSTIQLIGSQMRDIFNPDIVYLALFDSQSNQIQFPYQFGKTFEPIPFGEGLASRIIQTGEPILFNKDAQGNTMLEDDDVFSYLGVPIKTSQGTIGVISVQNTKQGDGFTEDSLRLLATISANAGAALHNAQLFSEALENLRQVEILTNAASAIEQSAYEPAMVESVAARTDALGELARVFRKMADEVRLREQRLKRQLAQLQLDIEEKQLAKAETVAVYIPMDRRQALANGRSLPEFVNGAALFADVSGFTTLTEALANELGPQRGAEELIRQLNRVYSVLIDEVHRYGGSVINFSGDAITCWFDDLDAQGIQYTSASSERAAACAFAMQKGMVQFAAITRPDGKIISLAIKAAVAAGSARRMLVGDGTPHQIDVLAGATLSALSNAEHFADKGETVISVEGISSIEDKFSIAEWREEKQYAVITALKQEVPATPWAVLPAEAISETQAQPWMLPAVFEKVRLAQSDMLSELRQVAALFLKFGGLDYDNDPEAGECLNTFIQWVEQVITPHNGSIIQLTVGDKGSYLYVVFGAPIANRDDAAQAVLAALELASPPETLTYITNIQIGLAYGQMRVGAYGGSNHRTYGAIGDMTNLAARLMVAATPSSEQNTAILCNDSIYLAAQTQVEFEALPPIMVKGKTQPIAIYRPMRKLLTQGADSEIASHRIDRLLPAEQLTLKVASVIGQLFTLETLSAIYPEAHTRDELQAHLQVLAESDLVYKRSSESSSYGFKDSQIHEAAYNLMLFAQRRQLHRAMAELLEQTVFSIPPYAEIAHHWQAADEIPKAVQYLEKAGEHARQMGDFEEATRFFNESLTLGS